MKAARFSKANAYLLVGGMGLAVAVGYLTVALGLPFGRLDQPGAAVFPIFVAAVLVVASLATIHEGWSTSAEQFVEFPAGADGRRVVYLVLLLFGFFFALPWLGQLISSTLFCVLLMRVLSAGVGWTRTVAYSAVLALAIDLVFEKLLKVPLPHGVLGL